MIVQNQNSVQWNWLCRIRHRQLLSHTAQPCSPSAPGKSTFAFSTLPHPHGCCRGRGSCQCSVHSRGLAEGSEHQSNFKCYKLSKNSYNYSNRSQLTKNSNKSSLLALTWTLVGNSVCGEGVLVWGFLVVDWVGFWWVSAILSFPAALEMLWAH